MNSLFSKVSRFIFLLLIAAPVFAQTSVWKISKGDQHLFLGGTIHVLSQSDYPLPEEFEQAYQQSEHIVFETDIAKMQTIEVQQELLTRIMLPAGQTLQTLLSQETYHLLEKYVAEFGLPMQNLNTMKPGMIVALLETLEAQRIGLVAAGVDAYFSVKSLGDGKSLGYLESIDQQLSLLLEMGKGQEDQLIAYSIRDLRELEETMPELKTMWRTGDMDGLAELILDEMKSEFPVIYKDLFLDRNKAWIPQIELMLSTSEIEFVLGGVAHMAGDDGLLIMLSKLGYTVEQM